jgi:hypothetical protein
MMLDVPTIRRFGVADLSSHAKWVLPRILAAYPHLNERSAAGWLRSLSDSSEHLFLLQPHAVALAQLERANTLAPNPIIRERFVLAENEEYIARAAEFYDEFVRWARNLGAKTLIVEELTDVPHEMIEKRVGTIRNLPQKFVRV